MGDAGFFKGTSAEQDARFADKKKKLMKTMKFGDNLSRKIDMTRINLECVRPWIVKRITELLNFEDEVVCDYVFNQLEERHPDPKDIQMNITGFLNSKNARIFLTELWDLLLSAMESPGGIPAEFVIAKKNEIIDRQQQESRAKEELQRKDDFKAHRKVAMTTQLAATPLISFPHKPDQAIISVTPQGTLTGCEPSVNPLAGQSQTEKPGKPRDHRRRSRSSSSSSSTSSRSSASSDYRRRRRRRKHHRRQRRKRSYSRSRSNSNIGKKKIVPDSDWRKDLMAGRRRSPPQMPENSYYGTEKHDKQRPTSRDRRHSRDDREEKSRASRTNSDAAGGHSGGGGVCREENDPTRNTAWSRQPHRRRQCTESSASGSGDDVEWRNRSPKQQTVPEVDHHHEAAVASMDRRHRSREVYRGRGDDSRSDYRDQDRDRYRMKKHATDWMYEAEEMAAFRADNDGNTVLPTPTAVSQAKPGRRNQNGQRPPVEQSLPVGSSGNRGIQADGAVTRGDADMTIANSKLTVAEADPVSSSSSTSSSSSSGSASDSEDVSSSSDSSVTSDEVAVSTGNQPPPKKLQQRQQKPVAASAISQLRGVTSAPTQSPEGPSLPPTPASAAKQRKVSPEGPNPPPKPASLDTMNNGRVPAGPLSSSASKLRGSEKRQTKELAAVGAAGDTKSASSDSGDSSDSETESSSSESESDTGSSSGSDSSDSGSSESSSESSTSGEAAGQDKPPRLVQRLQAKQQQPFSLPGKRRRTLPDEKLTRALPEGPEMPPAKSQGSGTPVDGESSIKRSDKKSVDKHEEALRRRALASMLRASDDRRRSP